MASASQPIARGKVIDTLVPQLFNALQNGSYTVDQVIQTTNATGASADDVRATLESMEKDGMIHVEKGVVMRGVKTEQKSSPISPHGAINGSGQTPAPTPMQHTGTTPRSPPAPQSELSQMLLQLQAQALRDPQHQHLSHEVTRALQLAQLQQQLQQTQASFASPPRLHVWAKPNSKFLCVLAYAKGQLATDHQGKLIAAPGEQPQQVLINTQQITHVQDFGSWVVVHYLGLTSCINESFAKFQEALYVSLGV